MITKETYTRYASDPAAFRADLILDVDGLARRLGDAQDDWQREDFASLDPGLMRCTGQKADPEAQMRAYLERGRGHSKTTDLAVTSVYALAFATRPIRGYCFAADKDQAKILHDAIGTIIRLNPWIGDILKVESHRVVNKAENHPGKGAILSIEASDVGSSFGILPDLIIADELCHWEVAADELWNSLISSAAKRSNCLMVVISNAGFATTWQWNIREAARQDPSWIFSRLDGPVASWLSQDRLDEQKRMLPAIAFARLWENQWSSGGGDALLPSDIDAAFQTDYQPMTGTETGYRFVAGADLGLTRDFSAVVVLAVNEATAALRLADAKLWKPSRYGGKVNIGDIEREIIALDKRFTLQAIAIDPWQAEHLGQRLESLTKHRWRSQRHHFTNQPWVRVIPPTGTNLREQASLTIQCFQDHRFRSFPYEPLRSDLLQLRVEERSYGFRCVSPRTSEGHGDTYSAFALALLIAHEQSTRKRFKAGALDPDAGRSEHEKLIAHLDQGSDRLNRTYGFGCESDYQENFLKAMHNLQRTDPFFQQFRR